MYSHIIEFRNRRVFPSYATYSTSLNESHVSLVNQSLYSSVEIRGTKSLKDQDHNNYAQHEWSINWLPEHATAEFQQQREGQNPVKTSDLTFFGPLIKAYHYCYNKLHVQLHAHLQVTSLIKSF